MTRPVPVDVLAEIISDAEIVRVHGHANFGPTMTPRDVVNEGVLKYAIGYHSGHTQLTILLEHGLITKPRPGSYDASLTKKGKRYARALHSAGKTLRNFAALRAPSREPEGGAAKLIQSAIDGIMKAPDGVITDTIWTADAAPMTVVDALLLAQTAFRAQPQARDDAQTVALPTDEGGCVTKRFVVFTTPGEVPEKKGGWLKDEHLIDFLRAVMLHDDWKPGFRASVLELTWDNDLWASSATEYLSMHDDAIGPRRARKAWEAARAEHERIYKAAPKMKLGDEIDSYRKATAISQPAPALRIAVADIAAERQRQIEAEGRTPEADDGYRGGELAAAASAYAFSAATRTRYLALDPLGFWPWSPEWFKPKDQRSDLVRAGALIVAEIERIDRAKLLDEDEAENLDCPICKVRFKADDLCLTDIDLGPCHTECLADSPAVDLDTGEPLPEAAPPPTPYRYDLTRPAISTSHKER